MFGGGQLGGSMAGSTVVERNLDRLTIITGGHLRLHHGPPRAAPPAMTAPQVTSGTGDILRSGWAGARACAIGYRSVGQVQGVGLVVDSDQGQSRRRGARRAAWGSSARGRSSPVGASAGAARSGSRRGPGRRAARSASRPRRSRRCADWIATLRGLVVGQLGARQPDAAAGVERRPPTATTCPATCSSTTPTLERRPADEGHVPHQARSRVERRPADHVDGLRVHVEADRQRQATSTTRPGTSTSQSVDTTDPKIAVVTFKKPFAGVA